MSTLTISLTRTELPGSLTPLVLSAVVDANALGIANYTEPPMQARIRYAPSSDDQHGDVPLSSTYQQTFLQFDVVTDLATTEAASRTLLASLRAALSQFAYTATVVINGSPAETWACNTGSIAAIPRTYMNLEGVDPVASVQIPCHPVRSIAS